MLIILLDLITLLFNVKEIGARVPPVEQAQVSLQPIDFHSRTD